MVDDENAVVESAREDGPLRQLRVRVLPALICFFVLWPAITILGAASSLGREPLISILPWSFRVTGATGSIVHIIPELTLCSILLAILSTAYWSVIQRMGGTAVTRSSRWLEPILFLLAASVGVVLIYPALLRHVLFLPLRPMPVFVALTLLGVTTTAVAFFLGRSGGGRRGGWIGATGTVVIIGTFAVYSGSPFRPAGQGVRNSILLFGIDSLAQTQDVRILRKMADDQDWIWFQHPVTPGLLTNSVWPSILMNRFPQETGCFLTFQNPNWRRSPYLMTSAAESEGFETWSFFSDQFTTYVGTNGGFEVDRSGPKGWLQPGTAAVKDASILLPILLRRLPIESFARTPANQSGTFAFDVVREIDEILTAGNGNPVFVAAHLDYLHQPAYPGLHELSWSERRAVLVAKSGDLRDLSLHWQYPPMPGEPLGLYAWKLNRLQTVVRQRFQAHQIAEPGSGNRVAIFSDHGPRGGLHPDDFSARYLYKVVLMTFGSTAADAGEPISLLDLDRLIGLPDASRPERADPMVQYTHVRALPEGLALMGSADPQSDGELHFNPWVVAELGKRLKAYFPHEAHRGYLSLPAIPGELDGKSDPAGPPVR